jgi:hypothetical protein
MHWPRPQHHRAGRRAPVPQTAAPGAAGCERRSRDGAPPARRGLPMHTPHLAGSVEWVAPDGTASTLALLHAWVPNQGSAWTLAVQHLARELERAGAEGEPAGESADAIAATWMAEGLLGAARLLGQRTAELHATLARQLGDTAFDPEPAGPWPTCRPVSRRSAWPPPPPGLCWANPYRSQNLRDDRSAWCLPAPPSIAWQPAWLRPPLRGKDPDSRRLPPAGDPARQQRLRHRRLRRRCEPPAVGSAAANSLLGATWLACCIRLTWHGWPRCKPALPTPAPNRRAAKAWPQPGSKPFAAPSWMPTQQRAWPLACGPTRPPWRPMSR